MASKYLNLIIDQGTDFSYSTEVYANKTTVVKKDLDNYTANAQMRKSSYHTNAAITFECSIATDTDVLTIVANNAVTSSVAPGKYVYDVEIRKTADGTGRIRVLEGIATVTPEVTK
jgi:hypothetical protein